MFYFLCYYRIRRKRSQFVTVPVTMPILKKNKMVECGWCKEIFISNRAYYNKYGNRCQKCVWGKVQGRTIINDKNW